MIKFSLKPYDVLFFGSGRPFNRGDVVSSIFPPSPNTFASAICSKMYHIKNMDISEILKAVYGPFISKENKIYFPKPQNIYGERKKKDIEKVYIVEPSDENRLKLFKSENTNKPKVEKIPLYKGKEEIEPFTAFISLGGLKNWLNNKEIDRNDILLYKDIFENEPRIGISIDPSLYSIGGKEDALFRVEFLRLKENIEFVFWVEFDFSNNELNKASLINEDKILEFFNSEPKALKLGGEMKNVSYEVEKDDFNSWVRKELGIENNLNIKRDEKIQVLFFSYGVFDFGNDKLPKINGFEIYSACFGNYEIIGINSKNLGRKIKRAFPPGTVLWLKSQNDINISNPIFLVKNQNGYYFNDSKGRQEFIGTNLVLIKKGG